MRLPVDDERAALFTVGQVADMLQVRQAFLRRIDEHHVVSPQRSPGGQRRYSRHDIDQVKQVTTMMGQGMTLPAIRRIIELQHELAAITRERDDLAARLATLTDQHTGQPRRGSSPPDHDAGYGAIRSSRWPPPPPQPLP